MNNFKFHARTDIRFGRDQIINLPGLLTAYGKNVLLVYGGGSIKKLGLYGQIIDLLKGFSIVELPGVEPNPRITSVREGVRLCKQHKIDVVLAVGGGSCIDAAKVIAGGAFYDGDPWDLVVDPSKIDEVLPIVTVLTLAATGSEMNGNAVISNMETKKSLVQEVLISYQWHLYLTLRIYLHYLRHKLQLEQQILCRMYMNSIFKRMTKHIYQIVYAKVS